MIEPNKTIFSSTAYVLVLILISMTSVNVKAAKCNGIFPKGTSLVKLQKKNRTNNIFVNSKNSRVAVKHQVCGPACGVNIVQGILAHLGLPLIADPYTAIEKLFQAELSFRNEGGSFVSGHKLISFLISKYFPEKNIEIETLALGLGDAEVEAYGLITGNFHIVDELTLSAIRPGHNEFKMISYLRQDTQGELFSGHFVLVSQVNGKTVSVVDPASPFLKLRFKAKTVFDTFNTFPLRTIDLEPGYLHLERAAYLVGMRIFVSSVSTVRLIDDPGEPEESLKLKSQQLLKRLKNRVWP